MVIVPLPGGLTLQGRMKRTLRLLLALPKTFLEYAHGPLDRALHGCYITFSKKRISSACEVSRNLGLNREDGEKPSRARRCDRGRSGDDHWSEIRAGKVPG